MGKEQFTKGPRLNEQIRITPIRLIDENNEQRGVTDTQEALRMARELGLDLVEIAPQERPPVCRIMDYGKHKYLAKKKQKQNVAHEITMKEVRLRPKTDDHDRDIKLNQAERFLAQGHKVQFTMLFRGRERQHRDIAMETFNEITTRFAEVAKIERPAKFENKRMTMVLAATKKPAPPKPAKKPKPPKPAGERPAPGAAPEGGEQHHRPAHSPMLGDAPLPTIPAVQPAGVQAAPTAD